MKRPPSLTLLRLLAGLFGGYAALTALLSIKHITTGAWDAVPAADIATHVSGYLLGAVFGAFLFWAINKRKAYARPAGAGYLIYIAGKFFYTLIFIPTSQRALSDLRLQYENPGFGLMMENVLSFILIALLLWWAYLVFSSSKVKEYLAAPKYLSPRSPQP